MSADVITGKLIEAVARIAPRAEALARVREGTTAYLRFAAGELTTSGAADINTTSLTVAIGRRHATVTTNQRDDAALNALARRAVDVAGLAPEDREWVAVAGPTHFAASPAAHDAATRSQAAETRADAAREAIALARSKQVTLAGFYEARGHDLHLRTSAGLSASHSQSVARFTVTARSSDGTGSGWAGAEETVAASLDTRATTAIAIEKCIRSQRPVSLAPGRYDVVLEPAAVAELLGFLTDGLDARAAEEGRSFFSRPSGSALGERLFSDCVTLRSEPGHPSTAGAPFDADGTPLTATTWIENGTLNTLRSSRFWAGKKGTKSTGDHSVWQLSGGSAAGVEALVKQVARGVLVTRLWYCRWLSEKDLMVTGLTRDGVFLIEDGKVTSPVNNFRFNDSPARVLASVSAMTARSVRVASADGAVRVPALAAGGFNMASTSAAV